MSSRAPPSTSGTGVPSSAGPGRCGDVASLGLLDVRAVGLVDSRAAPTAETDQGEAGARAPRETTRSRSHADFESAVFMVGPQSAKWLVPCLTEPASGSTGIRPRDNFPLPPPGACTFVACGFVGVRATKVSSLRGLGTRLSNRPRLHLERRDHRCVVRARLIQAGRRDGRYGGKRLGDDGPHRVDVDVPDEGPYVGR